MPNLFSKDLKIYCTLFSQVKDSFMSKFLEVYFTLNAIITLGGFEVNFMDDVGQTLLNWASAFGTLEMVSYFSRKKD